MTEKFEEILDKTDLIKHLQETLPPMFGQKVMSKAVGKSEAWAEQQRWAGTGPEFFKLGGTVTYSREGTIHYVKECMTKGRRK